MTNTQAMNEQSIRQVVSAYEEAWNRHDMDAMVSLFTDDIEWVSVVGMSWRGLPDVKRGYMWIHETLFKNTPIHVASCSLRLVTPEPRLASSLGVKVVLLLLTANKYLN